MLPEIDLQQLLDAISSYVMFTDEEHQVLLVNEAIETQLGLEPEEIVGGYCPQVVHGLEEGEEYEGCPLPAAIETGEPVTRETYDDKVGWFESAIYPTDYTTSCGNRIYLHMIRDINKRKEAEKKLQESHRQLQQITDGVIKALSRTVEKKDPYTAQHQRRCSRLASAIAEEMELGEECADGLRVAGLIHDIGKMMVPAEILNKPGELGEHEFELVQMHAEFGYDTLKEIEFPWPVAQVALQHHERLDGSGYPQGLEGDEIIVEAKIMAVADVVEAMTFRRPYREALGIEAALNELRQNRGLLYDPSVVEACLNLFKKQSFSFQNMEIEREH